MPRPLRVQDPGASSHVMSRDDRRRAIFGDEEDRRLFLCLLGWACEAGKRLIPPSTDCCVHPNEENLALANEYPNGSPTNGYLWTGSGPRVLLKDKMVDRIQPAIGDMVGTLLSNADASGTIHLTGKATYGGHEHDLVATKTSDGTWDFRRMQLPAGITAQGVYAINNSGVMAAIGSSGALAGHVLLLFPVTMRLLNGNSVGQDGLDFDGNRPTKISQTSNYVTAAVIAADIGNTVNQGNDAIDTLGIDKPLGQGRPPANVGPDGTFAGNCYLQSLMLLAQVLPPSVNGVTYKWNRTYRLIGVAISHEITAGKPSWYVRLIDSVPVDVGDYYGNMAQYETTTASADKSVISIWDNPGMYLPRYAAFAQKKGDYAYQKFVFTYTLTVSGSASSEITQPVGLKQIVTRQDTTGTTGDDWGEVSNTSSTTNLLDCSSVTSDEIRAIVGGSDPIVFDPKVKH